MNRKNISIYLNSLITLGNSISDLKKGYSQTYKNFSWNCDELITLKKSDIVNVCDKFLQDKISPVELEEWADMVEGTEAVSYETEYAEKIGDLLFLLSNPDINGTLDKERVKKYLKDF